MTYIFMIAGKGSRLHPLTLNYPKSLYRLDKEHSIFKRMVSLIRKNDKNAKIVAVVGFMKDSIEKEVDDVIYVYNPFYSITNSIASLWFAREYLNDNNCVLINGDIVVEERIVKEYVCKPTEFPYVLVDSSIRVNGDYNVQVHNNKVVVMSKDLDDYYGEYCGVTKLNNKAASRLKDCIEKMISEGMYDQWYENALVNMIFNEDFELFYEDISRYKWTEVDCVNDMLLAKQIHGSENC